MTIPPSDVLCKPAPTDKDERQSVKPWAVSAKVLPPNPKYFYVFLRKFAKEYHFRVLDNADVALYNMVRGHADDTGRPSSEGWPTTRDIAYAQTVRWSSSSGSVGFGLEGRQAI